MSTPHQHDDDDEEWEQILLARNHFGRMSLPHQWARASKTQRGEQDKVNFLCWTQLRCTLSSAGHKAVQCSWIHCIVYSTVLYTHYNHYTRHANILDNITLLTLFSSHFNVWTATALNWRRETYITALGNINYWILPFDNRIIVMIDEEEKSKVGLEKWGIDPFNWKRQTSSGPSDDGPCCKVK